MKLVPLLILPLDKCVLLTTDKRTLAPDLATINPLRWTDVLFATSATSSHW